jgi:hypothetical protein
MRPIGGATIAANGDVSNEFGGVQFAVNKDKAATGHYEIRFSNPLERIPFVVAGMNQSTIRGISISKINKAGFDLDGFVYTFAAPNPAVVGQSSGFWFLVFDTPGR